MFLQSDVLGLFQNNTDLSLDSGCPPLLISLTAKTIPYGLLGVCVIDFGGLEKSAHHAQRILTNNDTGSSQRWSGTGSNYLLELYVTGGLFAVYFGSLLFGFTCRSFCAWCGKRSLFAGIWRNVSPVRSSRRRQPGIRHMSGFLLWFWPRGSWFSLYGA